LRQFAACWALLGLLALAAPAIGQDLTGKTIHSVTVEGLVRVGEQLVRSQLEVQAGQTYNASAIARDIRRLYDLGHFSTIRADAEPTGDQVTIKYILEEKRYIEEIKVMGNDKIRTRQIRSVLTWREGDSFVPEAYTEEREAIVKLYQGKGFPNASVDIVVEELAPSRVRVTYNISENRKARIRKITFVGNEALSQRDLRKLMKTKRARWFLGGKYDEAKFEDDLKKVVDEYGNVGRLEANVPRTEFQYDDDGKDLLVTVYVEEGPEYKVETLDVANNQVYDKDEILNLTEVGPGEVHNKGQVVKDAELITKGYQDSGYINAKSDAQVTLDRENKTTHIIHRINEDSLKYVREIRITGNKVTKDEVIRRQVLLVPGERFDGSAIKLSQRTLDNSQYFENVRFSFENLDTDDRFANMYWDVEETKTGEFGFGAGYGTEDGLGGFVEVKMNNFDIANWPTFSGGGQQMNLKLSVGQRKNEYHLSFTDPEIAGWPLAFGFDVYSGSEKYRGGADFEVDTTGGQIRFGKMLSPFVRARTALKYVENDISGEPFYYNFYTQNRGGGDTTISNLWGIERNTVDNTRDPSSGYKHDVQVEIAGLGGDNEFYKLDHDSQWYRSAGKEKKWVLSLRTREGWINNYGSSEFVPINYRYFAGGTSTVRGYDTRDIGPERKRFILFGEEERVGGEFRIVENLEAKYKINDVFRAYVFADAGGVWREFDDFSLSDMKYSVGVGVGAMVPRLGPIRLDYGFALNPDEDQGSGKFHILTGFRF
jgi:outer membrane protein insertion porin family